MDSGNEQAAVEACMYCGEAHPQKYTCRQWARETGSGASDHWEGARSAALPVRPSVPLDVRVPKRRPLPVTTAGRVLILCLAVIGAAGLAWNIGGHFAGSGSGAGASLPACTEARIRQNLGTATTIQAEATTSLYQRIDATNALLLSYSDACTPPLLMQYTAFIEYQTLCLQSSAADVCKSRNDAHTRVIDALNNP